MRLQFPSMIKKRAIDIYENLNLGGKSLSVFDLILAKASRHTREKGNLFTQIVDDIERDHREEYTSFVEKCSPGQKNSYKNHIADSDKPYSAVGRIGCWDKSQKELSATYIKALMNLLGIIDYFSEGDPGFSLRDAEKIQNLNVKVTKREYLLQIPSEKNIRLCGGGMSGLRPRSLIFTDAVWNPKAW